MITPMKTNKVSVKLNRVLLISTLITLVLLLASLAGMIIDFYLLQLLKAKSPGVERFGNPYTAGFFIQALLCISMVVSVYQAFRQTGKFRIAGIALSVLGTLSFCFILMGGIAINEFYEEYYIGGWNADFEYFMVILGLAVNLVFVVTGFFTMVLVLRGIRTAPVRREAATNEFIFEITQYVGVVCGIIGTVFTWYAFLYLDYYSRKLTPGHVKWVFACCLIFMMPYLSAILYWVIRLAFKKDRTLYDEKQQHDLSAAGLATWLLSIPLMSIFMFMNYTHHRLASGIIVFPFYVFTTLLIFSTAVLVNFKRN
jgi:hypothetical protein